MRTPCKKTFKYPSYDCYKDIKEQFVNKVDKNKIEIIPSVSDFVKSYGNDKLQNFKNLSDVFTNLQKYLSNGHVFVSYDIYNSEGTCDYISYLLYGGILNKKSECNVQTFNYFKEFVDSYNEHKKSSMCNNKLKHLEYEEFQKRKALYTLYDWYDKLVSLNGMPYRPHICNIVESIIYNYNNFNKSFYEKDEELLEKLNNLKPLIKQHTWVSQDNCHASLSNLQTLKSDFLEREKQLKLQGPESTLTLLSNQSPNIQLEREGKTISRPAEGQSRTLDVGQEQIEARGHESKVTDLDELEVTQTRRGVQEDILGPTGMTREEKTIPEKNFYQYSYDRDDSDYTKLVDGYDTDFGRNYRNPIIYPQITPNDQERASSSVMSTITSALKDVDPVPVVVVSGGMGALFLLFRYTPFGTFFRGGRGRAHRIPRSFNGQFLGGFPGYEDYDVGHIGYGPMNPLAE